MSASHILSIDQGTSSSRAVIYDRHATVVATAQAEFEQHYPQPGWVEHQPEDLWSSVRTVSREALQKTGLDAADIAAIGITNQRETTLLWNRNSGECIYPAIVWQDRRTAVFTDELKSKGLETMVTEKTGLKLDPYFSASKIRWILDNVAGARQQADAGELLFGTVDCFLLWRLSGGRQHATDATNASRTLLFNIHDQAWDPELLKLFDIPPSLMPEVRDSAAEFGQSDASFVGASVPVMGIAGDQQAALIGQAGFEAGITKCTFGTGCFVIANTGSTPVPSANQLLTTVANRMDGVVTYGLEGSVFVAGSAMQWLRDELRVIDTAPESETIAETTGIVDDIFVVPAFAGLGAPYWDPHARGAILGLTRGSNRERIVTATLQSIAYQTADLFRAMADDGISPSVVRVDGGMVGNGWFLQFLADMLDLTVERPSNVESTVLGAAYLAGLKAGVFESVAALDKLWQSDAKFSPAMSAKDRSGLLDGWSAAIAQVRYRP